MSEWTSTKARRVLAALLILKVIRPIIFLIYPLNV